MQFQVPQFIEIEDKIFGPMTFKQFVYVAGGGGIAVLLYTSLPFIIATVLAVPVGALAGALAFYRINDRPFIDAIEAAIKYFFSEKLYLWKMRAPEAPQKDVSQAATPTLSVPKLSQSKLKDLAWSLDVHESIYAGTQDPRAGQ